MFKVEIVIPKMDIKFVPKTLYDDIEKNVTAAMKGELETFSFTGNLVASIGTLAKMTSPNFSGYIVIGPSESLGPASQGRPLHIYAPSVEYGTKPIPLGKEAAARVKEWAIAKGVNPIGAVRKIRRLGVTAKNKQPDLETAIEATIKETLNNYNIGIEVE